MQRLLDAVAPPRLGSGFRWLIGSSWLTNLGDGFALAAGPLLIEDATGDAALVGLSWMVARLPWLLFGLHSGVVADRFDRRVVVMVANVVRSLVLVVFAITIATGQVNVAVIMAALFVLSCAEVFADTASSTLLPMLVAKKDLGLGNARMVFGFVGLNQLVGPPVGALLFVVGMWVPFAAQAAVILLGVAMVQRIALSTVNGTIPDRSEETVESPRQEIVEGIKWIWANAPVRTLAFAIFFFNITFGGSFAVLVVLATERLGLGDFGFGLLIAMSAVGGVIGSVLYQRTEQRIGVVAIMRIGLMVEALTHLVLAISTTAAIAFVMLFFFGVHEAMWGTTSTSIRQAVVPAELQGRVGSVYNVGLHGGLVIGSGLGALLASSVGVTAPYWFGFVGSVVVLILIWNQLSNIAAAAEAA